MLGRDRLLKKTRYIFFLILICFISKSVIANSTKTDLLNYNNSLKNYDFRRFSLKIIITDLTLTSFLIKNIYFFKF